jgi:hypothetical protein
LEQIFLINILTFLKACCFQLAGLFIIFAHVAQSVEHFLGKEEVIGSNPIVGSRRRDACTDFFEKKEGLSHVEAEI